MMSLSQLACLGCFLVALHLNIGICQKEECDDCCSNYKELNEPRRSIKSAWRKGHRAVCDRHLESGWYRFTSEVGGKMPERKVEEYNCGTHDPIWLNGRHPAVNGGHVVLKACIHSFGIACDESFDINVKNCGDFYVYYLKPTYYCATAYCAGKN